MFDIAFSELLLIAVVALIVIGPERLPKMARTLGHLFGRMQRYVNDVKADVSREMELDELKKLQSSIEDTARTMRDSVDREFTATESELNRLAEVTEPSVDPRPAPAEHADKSASQQLDLALDPNVEPPPRKQA
jgi:sec-independent protein translocase protein TatB